MSEIVEPAYDHIPRHPKGSDFRDDPKDMTIELLLELAFQLYARACHPHCSESLHNRAFELKEEIRRRLTEKAVIPLM